MCQASHITADLVQIVQINLAHEVPFLVTHLPDDVAPGVHNHRVPVGLPATVVHAHLVGCHHIALILYRSRAEKRFPV